MDIGARRARRGDVEAERDVVVGSHARGQRHARGSRPERVVLVLRA